MKVAGLIFLTLVWIPQIGAQDTTGMLRDSGSVSMRRLYRDPHRAQVLGTMLPGAGHIYAGEYLRGYATYVVTITGIGMGPVVYFLDSCSLAFLSWSECKNPPPQWPHRLLGILMVGNGIWTWVSSARDAPRAAERANVKHQSKSLKVAPFVERSSEGGAPWHAGLTVHW